jgi:hypothetical protein
MTEEMIGRRLRDAVAAFEPPAYPGDRIVTRAAAFRRAPAPARRLRVAGAFAVAALALAIAGSAAFARPNVLSDGVIRALDRVGIHLRARPMTLLDTHEVSLDEARAAANFPVVVPLNVRVVRVLLSTDPRHRSLVSLVLQDGHGSQVQLDETRAVLQPTGKLQPAYLIDANGRITKLESVRWTLGQTRLLIVPFDAKSRDFADRVRRGAFIGNAGSR